MSLMNLWYRYSFRTHDEIYILWSSTISNQSSLIWSTTWYSWRHRCERWLRKTSQVVVFSPSFDLYTTYATMNFASHMVFFFFTWGSHRTWTWTQLDCCYYTWWQNLCTYTKSMEHSLHNVTRLPHNSSILLWPAQAPPPENWHMPPF